MKSSSLVGALFVLALLSIPSLHLHSARSFPQRSLPLPSLSSFLSSSSFLSLKDESWRPVSGSRVELKLGAGCYGG